MSKYKIFHAVESEPLLYGIRGISNILNTMIYLVAVVIGALVISKLSRLLGFGCLFIAGFVYMKMKAASKRKAYNVQKSHIVKPSIIQIRNSSVYRLLGK